MTVFVDHKVYTPHGYGYTIKILSRGETEWAHKTYSTLAGVKCTLRSMFHHDGDLAFIYKHPEGLLEAVAICISCHKSHIGFSSIWGMTPDSRQAYETRAGAYGEEAR